MAQVKFYATTAESYAAIVSKDAGGIYFVEGGELYKGTSRFGANKVWTTKPAGNAGVIGGDMYIKDGVAEVFNGSDWVGITNANKWTAASFGGEGSYITGISQSADGTVTATAAAFPTLDPGDNDGEVKLGSDSAKVSGWDTLVGSVSTNATTIASVSSRVTGLESIVSTANGGTVTASSGTFTNLTVTDTATFSVTTVSASALTVGGSTINEIAQAEIAASTLSGSISSSTGTGLVNEGQVVNYVSAQIQSFDNAMHYIGATSDAAIVQDATAVPSDITGYTSEKRKSGDIVLKGTEEFIWNGSKWEKIGDQSAVTGGSSASTVNGVTVDVVTAAATAAPSVTLTGVGTAAAANVTNTVTSAGTSLPTESAVATAIANSLVWLDASGAPIA